MNRPRSTAPGPSGSFGHYPAGAVGAAQIQASSTILFTTLSANVNLILVTTNGGPDNATQVMGSYVYQQAFTNFKVGYANTRSHGDACHSYCVHADK